MYSILRLGNFSVYQMLKNNFHFLQIVGEYVNVKSALFQVTSKLRENFFFSLASKGVARRQYPFSSMPESSLGEIWRNSSAVQTDLVPKPGGPHIWLHKKQVGHSFLVGFVELSLL